MYARTTMRVPNACARMFVCMRGNSSCVDGASNENVQTCAHVCTFSLLAPSTHEELPRMQTNIRAHALGTRIVVRAYIEHYPAQTH
mmetsp:Transcript_46376/g.39105  ORF Transcript_46376/g.39105 Transcript_46376/m.39105 type:complete len:86 (-) Transcript_46376:255-512(-)